MCALLQLHCVALIPTDYDVKNSVRLNTYSSQKYLPYYKSHHKSALFRHNFDTQKVSTLLVLIQRLTLVFG